MLDSSTKDQLKDLFSPLEAEYTLHAIVDPDHENRAELIALLEDVSSCSQKIACVIETGEGLTVKVIKNGEDSRISFRALPTGHEFTSFLMAIINSDGKGKNMPDEFIISRIKSISNNIGITTYMSLTCPNCPDVVQSLNIISLLNPLITHEAVDGAINEDEAARLNIQSVPTVYVNGELLHIGRASLGELLEKLEDKYDSSIVDISTDREYDIIIAGGGPAGATSAIYSARKGLSVGLITKQIGGQVNETLTIENLISIPSITGQQLTEELQRHLNQYDIDIFENRDIESVIIESNIEHSINSYKVITTKGGESFRARQLIIATGAKWKRLGVEGEERYSGRGVAFCPHCDGPFFKNREVAVVGSGNSGVEAAIDLAGICSKVTLIEYLPDLKADDLLQQRLKSLHNIEIITNAEIVEIAGNDENVNAIKYKDRVSDQVKLLSINGVFIQIGLLPNSKLFENIVSINGVGEVVTDHVGRTSSYGIYAAGDVTHIAYKQIIIAMGEGAKAALAAYEDKMQI